MGRRGVEEVWGAPDLRGSCAREITPVFMSTQISVFFHIAFHFHAAYLFTYMYIHWSEIHTYAVPPPLLLCKLIGRAYKFDVSS